MINASSKCMSYQPTLIKYFDAIIPDFTGNQSTTVDHLHPYEVYQTISRFKVICPS